MSENKGQKLIERIMRYVGRYVEFPQNLPVKAEGQLLVLALWAVHTWFYERFPATPYLSITAATKQAGKTICMEVLSLICRNSHLAATLRPLALVRVIEAFEAKVTLGIDEAEKLSSGAVGDLRSIFTTGYTSGGKHIVSKGTEFVAMRTHCPKMFAQIGDVMDVVHDRSIVVHLQRLDPSVDFRANRTEAQTEAGLIQAGILSYFAGVTELELVQPMFLKGREREIWTALFSTASMLKLDKATMGKLEAAAVDLVAMKGADLRKLRKAEESEEAIKAARAGEQAVRDLASVFRDGEKHLKSGEAVERMKGLNTSPWRAFRGVGLTADSLADLVRPLGVKVGAKRFGKEIAKGYSRVDVVASIPSKGE
jgi:hypothetical protein